MHFMPASAYDALRAPAEALWYAGAEKVNRATERARPQPIQKTPPAAGSWEAWWWSFFPSSAQVATYFTLFFHLTLAICCVLIAVVIRAADGGPVGEASTLFHRIVVTEFEEQSSLAARVRCTELFPGSRTDELLGVDSACACLKTNMDLKTLSANETLNEAYYESTLRECTDIKGAMPAYVLKYAGTVTTANYVFWAFICITASCVTSFTRMDAYPNHRIYSRGVLPIACFLMNATVLVHSWSVWTLNFDGFESTQNTQQRQNDADTCATIRFLFAFNFVAFLFHFPHLIGQINIFPCFKYPRQFIQPKSDNESLRTEDRAMDFETYFKRRQAYVPVADADTGTTLAFSEYWDTQANAVRETETTPEHLSNEAIQDTIHAFALNQRDQQFRMSYWQAVSEDLNFTLGCMFLAVAFSAHSGVHDDSTLYMDVCCVFMVGILQHMSHVLMLVKEYVFEDSLTQYQSDIGRDDREENICRRIGYTRLTIHFFVLSLIVFYCNRTAPSTFQDSEVTSWFQVARFSVILGLCVCNTTYDIFFETVHVIQHMTDLAPNYKADADSADQPSAMAEFLKYHAQYQGPYLWRVHVVLPLLLGFGAITAGLQHYRPLLKMTAEMQLS